jgi:expansin (peptidoglycan-binding protein)
MQNGKYKTACGYSGTESGSGQSASDTVSNIANSSPAKNTYFAAIPGTSSGNFNTVTSCGACIEITGQNGTKIVATIIDECPIDTNPACTSGHLDLSTQAFNQLGYSVGNPSGTTWKFVACPVTGNIQAVENANGQYYLQNSVYPITSVNGQGPTNYGYFNVNAGSVTVTSSAINQSITINIPSGGGDTGANFTAPTGCY